MPNRLSKETSPYLLQHAHNPVDWYPWGEEALSRAREENKPVLVSIGYAACHWCHVMERESFESEETAGIMNSHFINIKIDREERPDLDHIYMDAVQAMTGSGGWPLNVFLTPEGKPFYGGTYFPPRRAYERPSWQEVLMSVSKTFTEKRHEIDAQAENLTAHLLEANSIGQRIASGGEIFSRARVDEILQNVMKAADKEWGGFGKAPKFPQTFSIQFLLRNYHLHHPAKIASHDPGLRQALLSLDKMMEGGIYDQLGGGFARYSTDTEWLAPHFEKMLYDNALLVMALAEAYALTGKSRYREVIEETIQFVNRELFHPMQGFFSALDADSEGEEGKYYVWTEEEIKNILGKDASLFTKYYDVSAKGNWEGKNILRVKKPLELFAEEMGENADRIQKKLAEGRGTLMTEREKRIRPQLDDKVLLGWNALMNTALSKAYAATGNGEYRQLAVRNMEFLLTNFEDGEGGLHHTWKEGKAKYPAFLDDYAFLIQALIQLQEITGEQDWLEKARQWTELVIERFSEEGTGFFYFTSDRQRDVIIRKKEIYDGAVPSGNSIMAHNLYQLSIYFDRTDWGERSRAMVKTLGKAIVGYPTSFGVWASLLQEMVAGTMEIAIVGEDHERLRRELSAIYLPHKVLMTAGHKTDSYPLLKNREVADKTLIYLCENYSCKQPVESIMRFISLIDRVDSDN